VQKSSISHQIIVIDIYLCSMLSFYTQGGTLMRVAGYTRVSTQEQALSGLGLKVQRDKITAYCISQDWDLIDVYEDPGVTGATLDRPAFNQMMMDAGNGVFDMILTYKIDRISRSLKNLLILVEDTLKPLEIALKSVTESFIDTSSPEGMAMFQVLGTFSELERKQITRKLSDARIKKSDGGGYAGGYLPYGYDVLKGKLIINESEATIVKQIFAYRKDGHSLRQIVKELNDKNIPTKRDGKWNAEAVRYILCNILYTGSITYSGKIVKGHHDAIVSKILFNKVQLKDE
jgi:site-specific DNA recombinase